SRPEIVKEGEVKPLPSAKQAAKDRPPPKRSRSAEMRSEEFVVVVKIDRNCHGWRVPGDERWLDCCQVVQDGEFQAAGSLFLHGIIGR
ncbi:Hypothetical predicted protein, partial [Paramuricea clavata]